MAQSRSRSFQSARSSRPGRGGRRAALTAALVCAGAAACSGTVGPYIRSIEVTPDGVVIVEKCTTMTTDFGVGSTFDNDAAYCDKNILPLQGTPGAQQTGVGPGGPSFPVGPPPPPIPPATPAGVLTPEGAGLSTGGGAPGAPSQPSPGPAAGRPPAAQPGPCGQGMALIPAGSFSMGDRKDRVKVGKLCMDITEVTAEAYATCARIGQCSTEGLGCGAAATFGAAGKSEHPINCVDWNQASNYCQAQGKRLPTEEEWEWAARGGALGKVFPWGNVEPTSQVCWSGYGQLTGTCPVGSFPPGANPQGVLDLAGNVWEWTASKKDDSTQDRVARGGAWSSASASYLRASERYWTSPLYRFIYIGFRCVKSI